MKGYLFAVIGVVTLSSAMFFSTPSDPQCDSDCQRMMSDIHQAFTAPHMDGDEEVDRIEAKYGPPTRLPGETGAQWCIRLGHMYEEAGIEFHCTSDDG
jgi:hypothetical protein